jgi:DNA-binding CsgD family transcriptional regulator
MFETVQQDEVLYNVEAAAKALAGARGAASEFTLIFEYTSVPMVTVDADRRYVDANRPARLAFRRSLDEMRRLKIDDHTSLDWTREVEQAWARLLDTGFVAGRYPVTGRDGRRLQIVYYGLALILPELHLIAFAPTDWLQPETGNAARDARPDQLASLTPRESEVLVLAADGHSGPELAHELLLSPATVNAHFKNIYKKLHVGNRAAAVAKAMRLGLID